MPKLTDTQSITLSRAATRPGNLAMPLPEGLHGAAAKMAVTRMISNGWLEEVDADLRKGEPLWRETGDGHGTTLIATEAGLEAIGIEPVVAKAVTGRARRSRKRMPSPPKVGCPKPRNPSPSAPAPSRRRSSRSFSGLRVHQSQRSSRRPDGRPIARVA